MSEIHPSAIVSPGAVIGEGCSVGAYSVIGPHVRLGRGNRIGSHVVIDGHTEVGDENVVFQFASIGAAPQDLKFKGERSVLRIGNRNIIREYVTLQPGTSGGGMLTSIGDSNLFMACSHVGHDSHVGSSNVIANSAAVAGHVEIGSYVTVGGLCGIHQFVRVGDYSLLSAGAMVSKDVPPYCIVHGDRAMLTGLNSVGLERRGISSDDILRLRKLYRGLFLGSGAFKERLESESSGARGFALGESLLAFIRTSKRGVCTVRTRSEGAIAE